MLFMPFQFIDLKLLTKEEVPTVERLCAEYEKKIARHVPNPQFILQFKKHNDTGKKVKYSIHCRLEAPQILAPSEAHDWDLATTLHKVFQKIEKELEHKFKLNSQHKPFGKESRHKRQEKE